ncbi:6-phosphofructo-2-kinase 1 [Trichomonascus vanleenenianus]|uniref:6-phosphofructo-2-kinase n=1 Tax=Trichomonascus vanleenenianus TaxID=2268995 RepID=UPI003ECB9053
MEPTEKDSHRDSQTSKLATALSSLGSFNKRPPSDTPLISYTGSPSSGQHSNGSSGRNSPRSVTGSSPIPPLTLPPQRRATTLDVPGLTRSKVSPDGKIAATDIESKLVIVMVGLPARGKSYVTKKLCRFLNWQQHGAKIFNVGNTRRKADKNVGPASRPLPDSPHPFKPHKSNEELLKQAHIEARALEDELNGAPPSSEDVSESDESPKGTKVIESPKGTKVIGDESPKGSKVIGDESPKGSKVVGDESPKGSKVVGANGVKESSAEEEENTTTHAADFFSPDNQKTFELREKWAMDTLDELLDYILYENGSVGILDATNTTVARRKKVIRRIRERTNGRLKVLFLESICTKSDIIDANIRLKLSGPDYKHMDREVALKDFVARLHNYEKAYETIGAEEEKDEEMQYIKMIDVGRKVVCYNIQGFLAGQAVFFLLNFNLAERQIWITRHGESVDNAAGRIGGDAPLTPRGEKFARALARFMDFQKSEFRKKQLAGFSDKVRILKKQGSEPSTPLNEPEEPSFCVWTSMLQRSIQTAGHFNENYFDVKEMRMLNELGAGICDGMTYAEISEKYPQEYAARIADKIRYRYPGIGGESYLDVINRLRPVIVEMERMQDNALIIAHRVVCRVLLAYFMNLGRDSIGDLDIPLHTLYVLEPKPYGVDWAVYEYNEESDWFYRVPKETIKKQIEELQVHGPRVRSNSKPPKIGSGGGLGAAKDRHYSVVPTAPDMIALEKEKELLERMYNTSMNSSAPIRPPPDGKRGRPIPPGQQQLPQTLEQILNRK